MAGIFGNGSDVPTRLRMRAGQFAEPSCITDNAPSRWPPRKPRLSAGRPRQSGRGDAAATMFAIEAPADNPAA